MRTLIALLVLATAASGQAAIVNNGSFEMGVNPGAFTTLGVGSPNVTGWTVSSGTVDYIGSFWQASDGVRSIDMSGGSIGTISQTLALTSGKRYTLTFDLSANSGGGLGLNPYDIQVDLTGIGASTFSYSLAGANSTSNMLWSGKSLTFTAASGATTLSFTSLQNKACCWGPALDNVSVSAVPEASTWSMLIVGFGLVGAVARRRSQTAAVA